MFWGFCSSWGAFCFAVLVVLPLVLCFFSSWCCGWQWSFDAGHCYWCLSIDAPGMLGCFSFFWWLSVGAWGASARLGCSSSSLAWLRWRLSCGVCLFVLWGFCFLLSNCPLQLLLMVCVAFCASGLLLLFSLPFTFSSSSWLSSSLAVCVLCGLLPASLAWHCLVSGLPLCLVWSAPPDLF